MKFHDHRGVVGTPGPGESVSAICFIENIDFSKKKVDEKAKDLQIEPKIAEEMAKKIISDAKKHRFEKEL